MLGGVHDLVHSRTKFTKTSARPLHINIQHTAGINVGFCNYNIVSATCVCNFYNNDDVCSK